MAVFPEGKLGFGLMRLPLNNAQDAADVDVEQVKSMVDAFMEAGFKYFDTAWMYNGFASESVVKEALVDRYPRDSFALATKLHAGFIETREDRDKIFNEQLAKTGAGFFDYYLLHGVDASSLSKFEDLDCFDWLLEKREAGLAHHVGFSFHDTPEALERVLADHPEMEFVQLQINYLDWESEWVQSRACYEVATAHGLPIIVMEPVKGGTLAAIPPKAEDVFKRFDPTASPASWALRFAASLPGVALVLSGMSSLEQMRDNLSSMRDFKQLDEEEAQACFEVAGIINEQVAIPCTACAYCAPVCPLGIAIPQYFSLYNEDMREDLDQKGWTINFTNYETLGRKFGKASECIECRQCERACPQHLEIVDHLKAVAAHYEQR